MTTEGEVAERGVHESEAHPGGPHRGELVGLVGLTAVALAVRWVALTHRELWLDEAYTALVARAESWTGLLRMVAADNYPPLYFLGMRLWVAVFGFGEAAMRSPSVLAGVALVPLVWALVHETGRSLPSGFGPGSGPGARLTAAGLAGLSPVLVHYSLEARPYTLLWALAVGVVIALHRFVRRPEAARERATLVVAAGLTAIALGVHYFAVLLAPVWALTWWTARGRRLWVLVAGGVAALPGLLWALRVAAREPGATAWLAGFWLGPVEALRSSAAVFSLAGFPDHLGTLGGVSLHPPLAWAVGLWFGLPALAMTVGTVRRSLAPGGARALFLPLAAIGPPVLLALVSLGRPLYLAGRYELLGYPAWIALWALGVERGVAWLGGSGAGRDGGRRRSRALAWSGVCAVTGVGLALVLGLYLWLSPGPRRIQQVARELAASGEGPVVAVGLVRAPLQVQLWRLGDSREVLSFPAQVERHPGWMDLSGDTEEDLLRQARNLRDRIGARPVWIVAPPDRRSTTDPALAEILLRELLSESPRPVLRDSVSGMALWHLPAP